MLVVTSCTGLNVEGRALCMSLTDAGWEATHAFHAEATEELNLLITPLASAEHERFRAAMATIIAEANEEVKGPAPSRMAAELICQSPRSPPLCAGGACLARMAPCRQSSCRPLRRLVQRRSPILALDNRDDFLLLVAEALKERSLVAPPPLGH
jgi:hypothetical protein